MRYFTISELWGPVQCEHPGCTKDTFTIRLTDEENKRLPEQSGPRAIRFIFDNGLGKGVCDKHRE